MEFRNLRYFVMLAEELHFGKAAKRLYISQPPLSQQIQKLEEELGCKLFERNHNDVRLTFIGRALLPEAKKILEHMQKTIDMVKKASQGEYGEIRIGYGETASFHLLPEVMNKFRESYPLVEIILSEMSTDQQIDSLQEGKIDIGFIHPPKYLLELEHRYILTDPLIVILPDSHPLASNKEIPLIALKDEVFVVPLREAGPLAAYIKEVCQCEGFVPKFARHDVQRLTVSTLVAGGAGIALLPESSRKLCTPGTACVKLMPNELGIELHVAYTKGNNAIVTNFLRIISNIMEPKKE